uniref:Uncharacterized protein n=1 Tax=Tanacetum cinerariifolium TaxID=118510 RepID=A0A699IHE0_TANCI|nr:hypothetical protein [Tanacetum cinerariifolium]
MMKEEQMDIPAKGGRLMLGCLKNIEHVSIFHPASNLWIFNRKFVRAPLCVCLLFRLERKGYRLILTDMYLDYECRVYVDEYEKLGKNDEAGNEAVGRVYGGLNTREMRDVRYGLIGFRLARWVFSGDL